jgi:hypothetical protein
VRELKPWPPAVWIVNVFPAIALSMAIMAMRNTTYSIQTSVYVVYVKQAGLVGTTIGILFVAALALQIGYVPDTLLRE